MAIQPPRVEKLEGLGEVAQRQAVLGQLGLQGRAGGACLDQGGARDGVDLKDACETAEVDRDGAVVIIPTHPGLDSAHHARAATVGDRGDALSRAPGEQSFEIAVVAGPGDEVGGMFVLTTKAEHDIGIGLAKRMGSSVVRICGTDLDELRWWKHPGRRQANGIETDGLLDLGGGEAEVRGQTAGCGADLLGRRLLVLESPTPMLASALAHG